MTIDPSSDASSISPISGNPQNPASQTGKEPASFALPKKQQNVTASQPSPMKVVESMRQTETWTPQQMSDKLDSLRNKFQEAQTNMNSKLQNKDTFSPQHIQAFNQVISHTNPHLKTIGEVSQQPFTPPATNSSPVQYVLNWLGSSQTTLNNALSYASTVDSPNPAAFLRMQFAVNKAQQQAELFASLVGSTVSGIKTLMSTQLG